MRVAAEAGCVWLLVGTSLYHAACRRRCCARPKDEDSPAPSACKLRASTLGYLRPDSGMWKARRRRKGRARRNADCAEDEHCTEHFPLAEKVAIAGCFLKKGMSLIVQSFAQLDPISYLKLGFLDQLILSRFQDKLGSNYRRLAKVLSFEKYFPLITIILLTQNLQWL